MVRYKTLRSLVLVALILAACVSLPSAFAPLSPVAVATEIPNATAVPLGTPLPTPVEAATVVAASQSATQNAHISPDGRWHATFFAYPCVKVGDALMAYEELRLVDVRARVHPQAAPLVAHQLRYCEGLGAIGLGGLFWSTNSRYFYFTDAREGVPDGGCGPYVRPTLRLDTATFVVQQLGSGQLSRDRARLAAWQEGAFVIWDVETGAAQRLTPLLAGGTTGTIAWSPDSRSLAYVQTENLCPPVSRAVVVRVDLTELAQSLLLDTAALGDAAPSFSDLRWDAADTLRLLGDMGAEWRLDLTTGELRADR